MAANTVPTVTDLRPCKRHIATHDANGKSVYADSPAQRYFPVPGVGSLARSWSIASVPAKLARDADMKAYLSEEGPTSYQKKDIVLPQPGANLLVVDLAPGGVSDLHQTVSIDFSICVIGEIDHELDGGETDHIVQRGTMHRWRNASQTEPARFVAVTIPCEPFDIAGKQLEEIHIPTQPNQKL